MKAVLENKIQLLPDVFEFRFRPDRNIRFDAGQFIAVTVPHKNADDRGVMREFSISSPPGQKYFEITSSFADRKGSTYKKALLELQLGHEVLLGEPMGDFVLPKDTTIPLIFVAAGLGVTPFKSIVESLQSRSERREIQLIHSVSDPSRFLYKKLWRNYGLTFVPLVTGKSRDWNGQTGRLTPDGVIELTKSMPAKTSHSENPLIYLAGPQSMIEPLFNGLTRAGIPRSQLLLDYFPGY